LFINRSVRPGDINTDISTEYIKRLIQNNYLSDTSVLVVLVGNNTWKRKHDLPPENDTSFMLDWEFLDLPHFQYQIKRDFSGFFSLPSPVSRRTPPGLDFPGHHGVGAYYTPFATPLLSPWHPPRTGTNFHSGTPV
jgi:hypothetical protein